MIDYVYIGSSPCDEDCAQVGREGYHTLAKIECNAYIKQLRRVYGEEPEGVRFVIKEGEVQCRYNPDDEKGSEWAWKTESGCESWDDDAKAEIKAALKANEQKSDWPTEEMKKHPYIGAPALCDMKANSVPMMACRGDGNITDEFIDGATKQGPWANMCPKCAAAYGRGLGTGVGQRYKKSPDDGRFYKIEG